MVVEDDQSVHAIVAEILADGAARIRGEELQRRRVGRGGSHDGGELHGVGILQRLHELRDGGALLADGDVDAEERLLLVAGVVDRLLVDDGVDGDGGLASLTIAYDQLTLATADGHQAVDGLEAALHGLRNGLARDDTRGLDLDTLALHVALDRALAIDGVALLDDTIVTEDDNTNVVVLQVQSHTAQAAVELHHLTRLHLLQPVHTGNAITDGQDFADLLQLDLATEIHDFGLDDRRELGSRGLALLRGRVGRSAELAGASNCRDAARADGRRAPERSTDGRHHHAVPQGALKQ